MQGPYKVRIVPSFECECGDFQSIRELPFEDSEIWVHQIGTPRFDNSI